VLFLSYQNTVWHNFYLETGFLNQGIRPFPPGYRKERLMFGQYDISIRIEQEGITVSVQKEGENILFIRECLGESTEKILGAGSGKLLLNPVEPVNKPTTLPSHLLIEFVNTLQVEPKGTMNIFLTFPVEIAVSAFEIVFDAAALDWAGGMWQPII